MLNAQSPPNMPLLEKGLKQKSVKRKPRYIAVPAAYTMAQEMEKAIDAGEELEFARWRGYYVWPRHYPMRTPKDALRHT